jgi:hypothetical protein
MGFRVGNGMILNCITNNRNDSWGHAGLALSMLIIGFATARPAPARRSGEARTTEVTP